MAPLRGIKIAELVYKHCTSRELLSTKINVQCSEFTLWVALAMSVYLDYPVLTSFVTSFTSLGQTGLRLFCQLL